VSRFEYSSVLISIVIGLGVSEVLAGWARLILRRRVVRFYWVHAVWCLSNVLSLVEFWWGFWSYRGILEAPEWTLPELLAVVSEAFIGVLATLVLMPAEIGAHGADLRSHYFEHRRPFFALAAVWLVHLSAVEHWLSGQPIFDAPNVIRGLGLVLVVWAATSDRKDVHAGLALAALALHAVLVAIVRRGW
jgi:hypothetical protein